MLKFNKDIHSPSFAEFEQVLISLSKTNCVILSAPPGAGKSTILPLSLLNAPFLNNKKILMLEPRRLAVKSICERMSELIEEEVGQRIGFRIRFESKLSAKTKLEVVTEGILTRMLQSDNALQDYGLIIFDEFHERNLHADLALALCLQVQQILRPDLKILIMSATIDTTKLSDALKAPVIFCEGKQFPVEIKYDKDGDPQFISEQSAELIKRVVQETNGDILVFLPGESEIKKCKEILNQQLSSIQCTPLYGGLTLKEQKAAIQPDKQGKRKIVLATNIAETSLTIEGIKVVVDCGFQKIMKFDPRSGLSKLETVRISKDSANQRAGRAGRLCAGVCYRMWTAVTHSRLDDFRKAEILEADLCAFMLELYHWGIQDVNELFWLDAPPKANVLQAKDLLMEIDAVEQSKITAEGKKIHQLPCHPRLAHMLLSANGNEEKSLACDIAALLEEKDPLGKEVGVDMNIRLENLHRQRKNDNLNFQFTRIEKVSAIYRKILNVPAAKELLDVYDTGYLLAQAFPERVASARPGNNAQYQLANGRIAMFNHKDDLAAESWLVIANLDLREGMGKIFLAAPLNPKDLIKNIKEKQNISWNSQNGTLQCTIEKRLGNVVLESKPLTNPDLHLVKSVLIKAVQKEGKELLDFNEDFEQMQNRIESLKVWNSEEEWPEVDQTTLLIENERWLSDYFTDVKSKEDFKNINLAQCLFHSLNLEQQKKLKELTPEKIEVPSGSKIKVQYFKNGGNPVLAVRLQEIFGMQETPSVNNKKITVLMHILSPGYKSVQITKDLKSFWNNLYPEVRKELKRKYPKHAWPEDPWHAQAVKKGRSEKN
ncbi:MAG: ATP-dependent helicase HrpB [Sphingobacteriaceae bacterium]|nr:ATP-dependent helicase HrpB [Sphingobacteriaceae bacterium]